MSDNPKNVFAWHDLTVQNAVEISDFYCKVAGWTKEGINMGDYEDFVMKDAEGNVVAGICHARGSNAEIPPFWLPYIMVEDLDASLKSTVDAGGKILGKVRKMGPNGSYCLIEDPAGAYIMLACGTFQ